MISYTYQNNVMTCMLIKALNKTDSPLILLNFQKRDFQKKRSSRLLIMLSFTTGPCMWHGSTSRMHLEVFFMIWYIFVWTGWRSLSTLGIILFPCKKDALLMIQLLIADHAQHLVVIDGDEWMNISSTTKSIQYWLVRNVSEGSLWKSMNFFPTGSSYKHKHCARDLNTELNGQSPFDNLWKEFAQMSKSAFCSQFLNSPGFTHHHYVGERPWNCSFHPIWAVHIVK